MNGILVNHWGNLVNVVAIFIVSIYFFKQWNHLKNGKKYLLPQERYWLLAIKKSKEQMDKLKKEYTNSKELERKRQGALTMFLFTFALFVFSTYILIRGVVIDL